MRVLVTGATGRVGRQLVPLLQDEGHVVRVLQRDSGSAEATWRGAVELVAGSVTDAAVVTRAVAGVDAVCHLAALMPPHDDDSLFSTNVVGTYTVVEAIRAAGSRARLVLASTDATYGTGFSRRRYEEPIVESVAPQPTNFYGATKVLCEDLVAHAARLFEIDWLILRFSWVFSGAEVLDLFSMATWTEFMTPAQRSAHGDSDAVPVILEEDGSPFTEHVVDARDVARACVLAITSTGTAEAVNICGPAPFRYVDVSPGVAHRLGRGFVDVPLPSFHSYSFDASRARSLLGFEPQHSISDMLQDAFALRIG